MQLPEAMENSIRALGYTCVYALAIYWLWHYATPEQCAAVVYQIRALAIPVTSILQML